MSQRYHTASGSHPDLKASFHLAGPQNADQIPEEVRRLLDRNGVTHVCVMTDFGVYPGITVYRKIKDDK